MNIPLNIDYQQILLHWMNLAILTGGLYFLLFKPVKQFMQKREAYYKDLDAQADAKLAEAEQIKAEYQAKLNGGAEGTRLWHRHGRRRNTAGKGPCGSLRES